MSLLGTLVRRYRQLTEEQTFALDQLDWKLKPHLDFERGFFVEAGANDGLDQSNTRYFEKYRKWRGLLIEPIPELARQCRRNRPRCLVEHCALVPFDYPNNTVEMRYCNLMSLVKGAMKSDEMDMAHVQLGCDVQGLATYELQVPARTLTSVLKQHAVTRIDCFSLDVEGFELNVLKGLDLDCYRPAWMLIEARFREEIDSFLKGQYEVVAELSERDVLYKARS